MSPELGYAAFEESRVFGTTPVIDGHPLIGIPQPLEKVRGPGAHVLEHANGDVTLQLEYRDDTAPEGLDHYEWRFDVPARSEATWWHIEELWKRRARFYFVPWDQEVEPFVAGVSLSAWVLPRPTAVSILDAGDHPDVTSYPTLAWLDGVEQTVIDTGTPGTGEVKVVGRDVTTPTLTAGQLLVVRYVPAYYVAVTQYGPQRLDDYNRLTKSAVLTELRQPA